MPKILFFANTDWYLFNFRQSLAQKLKGRGWEVVLVSPPGEYGPQLNALGFKWLPFDFSTRSTNPLIEFSVILRLIRLYRAERPNLIHHFTIKCVLYGSIATHFGHRCSIVNAVTGLGHIFTDQGLKAKIIRPLIQVLYRFLMNQPNVRVIFQNNDDRMHYVRLGFVNETLTRLIRGSGVNCDVFKPKETQKLQSETVSILFASRLIKEKGIYEILAAAKILKSKGLAVDFIFAGDLYPGNPSSLTPNELEEIKQEGLVTYLGHVDPLFSVLAECDIVVLPSYAEGTPRILIEAAAMEKPIVCTDIPGCRGLVVDGVNGFLVPVKNVDLLADRLEKLVLDSELRETFGKAGRGIVLAEFDEKIVIDKTLAVYEELA